VSLLSPDDFDWTDVFGRRGTRWLHSGGIFCGLSESTPLVAERAFEAAREQGTVVSYDLNYRDSLWRDYGGRARAQSVNRRLAKSVDVLFGNEEDFSVALGFEVPDIDTSYSELRASSYQELIEQVVEAFPNVSVVATTLRTARSANVNGWGAIGYFGGKYHEVPQRDIEILDRVGGGDSFASGLIHGLLEGREPQWSLECGVAHGALAMSTPGDTSMARAAEVESAMRGGTARIQR
jgi:2-dehydro-3-deoxygluconokinase